MASDPFVIDAQLHEPPLRFDWSAYGEEARRQHLTELELAWMDAVGVDAAILFPIQDPDWALDVAQRFPERFGVVLEADPAVTDVDGYVRETRARHDAGLLALRTPLGYGIRGPEPYSDEVTENLRRQLDSLLPLFDACERHGVPVFLWAARFPVAAREIAVQFPKLDLVIDHFMLHQGPTEPRDLPPFARLEMLLALAESPHVYVKFSGAPALAEGPFPFDDLWPHLDRVVGTFGADRLMWGSDISRIAGSMGSRSTGVPYPGRNMYLGHHTYAEALHYLLHTPHLDGAQKTAILGGTAKRLLRWF